MGPAFAEVTVAEAVMSAMGLSATVAMAPAFAESTMSRAAIAMATAFAECTNVYGKRWMIARKPIGMAAKPA